MTRQHKLWGAHAPRVPFTTPRRGHLGALKRTTNSLSNLRPFGEAPTGARKGAGAPRNTAPQ